MKKFLIPAAAIWATTASVAGATVQAAPNSNSDAMGALVLLVIAGVVIATSAATGRAKAEKDPYLLSDDEDNNS